MSVGFYVITPISGFPCLRRRASLASAMARALAEFPQGVEEVRQVKLRDLAKVQAEGVALPPLIARAHRRLLDAKARKAAATARAADKRRDKQEAARDARREARRIEKAARDRLRSLAKAALTREANRAQEEAQKGAAAVPVVVLEEMPAGADLAPWD